jgi:hypothetical protein
VHSIERDQTPRRRLWTARTGAALATGAVIAVSAAAGASAMGGGDGMAAAGAHATANAPVHAIVRTPAAGERTSSGFNVAVSLQARNGQGNRLLSGYSTQFLDPTGADGQANPAFHPGASAAAPGLVVTLSTTPTKAGTPLQGPRTNLAGVFQINGVTRLNGLTRTLNDWQISSPGFFGKNTNARLTVYAVRGTAPAVVPQDGLQPVSNVVHRTFHIGA